MRAAKPFVWGITATLKVLKNPIGKRCAAFF